MIDSHRPAFALFEVALYVTQRILETGEVLEIKLLDHFIVS